MSYKPTIYKLTEGQENYLEIINYFIKTWYEIEVKQDDFNLYDFDKLLGVKISKKLNQFLNYLTCLNYTIVRGKKRMIYSSVEYLFPLQKLKIGYDENNRFLSLFQEGGQDFYYGIPQEFLLDENPLIYRLIKNKNYIGKEYEITRIEDCDLIEFLVSHICRYACKIGVKSFSIFEEPTKTRNQIEEVCKLFNHKTVFGKVTIFERDNAMQV